MTKSLRPTAKQVRILEAMLRKPVIAAWSHRDLNPLMQMGLVSDALALGADCKVHSSKIWTITDKGRLFLNEERAGA